MGTRRPLGSVAVFTAGIALAGWGAVFLASWVRRGPEDGFAPLGASQRLDEEIADRSPFTPPPNGVLQAAQVERLLAVERQVRRSLGPRFDELVRRCRVLSRGPLSTAERVDLVDLVVAARQAQVKALNREGFSAGEYDWVRGRAFRALGIALPPGHPVDLERAVEAGELPGGTVGGPNGDVPAVNCRLIEPHRRELSAWAPLAVLGL